MSEGLLQLLREEVAAELIRLGNVPDIKKGKGWSCSFCVGKTFSRNRMLRDHIRKTHARTYDDTSVSRKTIYQHLPGKDNGFQKILKLILAFYDDDVYRANGRTTYLADATTYIRSAYRRCGAVVPARQSTVYRQLIQVWDGCGPRYDILTDAPALEPYRRIGNLYITRAFANDFLRDAFIYRGNMRQIGLNYVGRCVGAGCPCWPFASLDDRRLFAIMEDLCSSQYLAQLHGDLIQKCFQHEEWLHLSIDATVKVLMGVKGQANYRQPAYVRSVALYDDAAALRRVLTVRGRTGAVLGMWPLKDESAETIGSCLYANVPRNVLEQVRHIATDDPSEALLTRLREHLPNLRFLSLDPVHLVIVYAAAHFRKRTPGQRYLRTIMNKFNKHCHGTA